MPDGRAGWVHVCLFKELSTMPAQCEIINPANKDTYDDGDSDYV